MSINKASVKAFLEITYFESNKKVIILVREVGIFLFATISFLFTYSYNNIIA